MITEHQLLQLATKAGFSANGINTNRVKLMLFAKYVWEAALASRKTGDNEKPE